MYLLDANVFIDAKNRYYGFDIVPAFWAADYFLVAQAHSRSYTVVTHEVAGSGSKKSVKIPDACNAVGVAWMTPFKMLSTEQVRFRL